GVRSAWKELHAPPSGEAHRQRDDLAEERVAREGGLTRERQPGEAPHERAHRRLGHEPRQRHAQADVDPTAVEHALALVPADVERVRVGEDLRVAQRAREDAVHLLPLADPRAADLEVLEREAREVQLAEAVVAADLVDGVAHEPRLLAEDRELAG